MRLDAYAVEADDCDSNTFPTSSIRIFAPSPSGMRRTCTADEIAEFGPPKPSDFWPTHFNQP